jgi:AraC-like DNA-binding protein
MSGDQSELRTILRRLCPHEGVAETAMEGLVLARSERPLARTPLVYKPSLCVVVQGRKVAWCGDTPHTYDPFNHMVVALPLPLEAEILVTPFLAFALELDLSVTAQLLLEMEDEPVQEDAPSQALWVAPLGRDLQHACLRLFRVLDDSTALRLLGPGIVREIHFYLLRGEHRSSLRAVALRDAGVQRMAGVVRYIHENYTHPLDVNTLARHVGLGSSTLHHAFKRTVGMSPMQYLKKIRLHQARLMMVSGGLNVGEAAYKVGYGSPSQFSREFKRLFGTPPSRAAEPLGG